jgi:ATP-dependent protease ClpP protease subunit
MYSIHLKGDINAKMLTHLTNELNAAPTEEKVNIYLSSNGGECDTSEAIIVMLNEYFEQYKDISLYVFGSNASAAIDVIAHFKGYINVLGRATGMYHLPTRVTAILPNGKVKDIEKSFLENLAKYDVALTEKTCKILGIEGEQYNEIINGKDVNFNIEEFNQLIESHNRHVLSLRA